MAKLCKSRKVVNSTVSPRNWFYGIEHCRLHEYSAVPTGEEAVVINLIKEDYTELKGYIHITNGGADPAPVGLTLIATVDASATADVPALYAAIEAALEAGTYAGLYQVSIMDDLSGIDIINNFIGLISEEDNTAVTELTVTIGQQSFGGAIGLLSEDGASAAFEFEYLDQLADATGNVAVEKFLISVGATITMAITDTSKDKFEELFIKPLGGVYEAGSDKLIGFGTDNFFKPLMDKMGKLIGHETSTAYTDRSNDWQMLAAPNPTGINFNKELQQLDCEFTSLLDVTMPDEVNIFSIGDKTIVDLEAL